MKLARIVCILVLTLLTTSVHAVIELPLLFNDGMVIQRDQAIHVWGWGGKPGDLVEIELAGNTAKTTIAKDGSWQIYLPELKAGGPYTLAIRSGEENKLINDVLIGDVWLCSGQSNMEWPVKDSNDATVEIANANDRKLRHFKVPKSWALQPQKQLSGGEWHAASPATVGDFTAVGYFFARELHAETNVPIGLINSSWGGSRIEPWMSESSLDIDKKTLNELLQPMIEQSKKNRLVVERKLARWPESAGGIVDGNAIWAKANLDDSDWADITVPALWETQQYYGMDGIAWYRTTFTLTAEQAKNDITLGLGSIDDSDQTWVNGNLVGETVQAWNRPRSYSVAAKVLKPGLNTLAIRVDDTGGGGGIHGDPSLNFVQAPGDRPLYLSGKWKFKADKVTLNLEGNKNQLPTLLYNKMIYPLQPYPVKGVIWYQGESNASINDAYIYRVLFGKMITSWRDQWQQKNLPFFWVQLANYISGGDSKYGSPWAVLRESQSDVLRLSNTAEAVIIDIGDPDDIHPRNKQDVGHRLALAARHLVYGERKLIYSGPRFKSYKVEGDVVRIKFAHTAAGLKTPGNQPLQGFTIAGSDRQFVAANARIKGKTVIVTHPTISSPSAVRYAWSDNPEDANLINSEALPASPFRTDNWPVLSTQSLNELD